MGKKHIMLNFFPTNVHSYPVTDFWIEYPIMIWQCCQYLIKLLRIICPIRMLYLLDTMFWLDVFRVWVQEEFEDTKGVINICKSKGRHWTENRWYTELYIYTNVLI
jgi:hypothetical protein